MNQLLSFFRFELRYHLRRPTTYVFAFVMALFGFLTVVTGAVRVGGVAGKVLLNSPYTINFYLCAFSLIGAIFTSAIAGTAILRDFELKTHELLFTTRLRKSAFVFGRFLGAYVVTALVLSCSALGLWLGLHMPWLDADKLGQTLPGTYLWPLLLYVAPTGLFLSAVFLAVGVVTRQFMAVYVSGIVLFLGWQIAGTVAGNIEYERLAALIDPFGLYASDLVTRDWTIADKNSRLIPLAPILVANRALWLAISGLILALSHGVFRMEAFARAFRRKQPDDAPVARRRRVALPAVDIVAGPRAALARLAALVRLHYRNVTRDRIFLAIVICGIAFTGFSASFADMIYGTPTYPVTYAVIELIGGFGLFFLILMAMYSGELVWRERQIGCDQLVDAAPTSSGLTFAGKVVALLLVHATLLAALIVTGVLAQTLKGYTHYELGVYLGYLYGIVFPGLVVTTAVAFFLHVVADNKYVGIGLVIAYYILQLVIGTWGVTDNLFIPSGFPDPTYSAMNGYGPDLVPWLWFYAYYLAFAGLLLLAARLLLVRGRPDRPTGVRGFLQGLRARLRLARRRVGPAWLAAAAALLLAFAGLFAFIRHNTHTLNVYRSRDGEKDLQAEYERAYKQYEKLPQPRIVASNVRVELYPARGHVTMKGSYRLVNKTGAPIDRVHLTIRDHTTIRELAFDRPAELEHDAPQFRYQIYKLAEPLAPGAEMALNFDVGYLKDGFGNTGRTEAIVDNGSFVTHNDFLPMIGYIEAVELADDDDRKERDLPPRERMHSIDDESARRNTYIASDSDWIDFAATVCTEPDQIALAPGYLAREWTEDGDDGPRRCFAYAMDRKILNFYSFLSARYAVRRDQWNDVAIEIYYHPGHEYNLGRMVDAVKKSLDYYTTNFSPYQHRQVRILEFPRYAGFAQAFPNTIPYSESIGFIARVRPDDPEDLDYPFYVTAHEVAHQWWAHQVVGADVQGATMLSESLSQYSALMVMEKEYGKDKMKKFLGYELKGYLQGRSAERKKELPLMLNENQPYIHYQKGSLVFYALKDYIGEDTLNAALARYIKQVGYQEAPFTTTRDLVKILREVTPPDYRYVIEDMFETITLYDNKVTSAEAAPDDGKFRVRFEVHARKLRADELGNETEVPIADFVDIGVFAPPGPGDLEFGRPLFFERRKLTGPTTEIEVVVDAAPARVGVDPYNKLIDRDPRDNTAGL